MNENSTLKLGVTQWTLDVRGVATVARAATLKFSYLQLDAGGWAGWPEKLTDQKDLYQEASEQTGVELIGIGLNPLNEISLLAPVGSHELKKAVKLISDSIEVAKYLKIPLVYVPSFNASEMKKDQDIAQTAAVLADLAVMASSYHIELASENTLSARQQLKLLDETHGSPLKLFIDSQNPVIFGHDVAELLRKLKDHICQQMHLKDGKDGIMGNCPLGEGGAKFQQTVGMIRMLELNPIFVFENEYAEDTVGRVSKDKGTVARLFV
ncbi:MAG: TIM barrel protein [Deinococcales bacterium]